MYFKLYASKLVAIFRNLLFEKSIYLIFSYFNIWCNNPMHSLFHFWRQFCRFTCSKMLAIFLKKQDDTYIYAWYKYSELAYAFTLCLDGLGVSRARDTTTAQEDKNCPQNIFIKHLLYARHLTMCILICTLPDCAHQLKLDLIEFEILHLGKFSILVFLLFLHHKLYFWTAQSITLPHWEAMERIQT